jgi:hypothetical protein
MAATIAAIAEPNPTTNDAAPETVDAPVGGTAGGDVPEVAMHLKLP